MLSIFVFSISSCEKYDECTIPVVGVYEAHIVGVTGSFDLLISIDHGDNIEIDAPWLEDNWYVLKADIDGCTDYSDGESNALDIDIHNQEFTENRRIEGDGFYSDYSIQIDYTIIDGNDKYHYKIVGSKK